MMSVTAANTTGTACAAPGRFVSTAQQEQRYYLSVIIICSATHLARQKLDVFGDTLYHQQPKHCKHPQGAQVNAAPND